MSLESSVKAGCDSEPCGESTTLIDRTLGIEFRRIIRTYLEYYGDLKYGGSLPAIHLILQPTLGTW